MPPAWPSPTVRSPIPRPEVAPAPRAPSRSAQPSGSRGGDGRCARPLAPCTRRNLPPHAPAAAEAPPDRPVPAQRARGPEPASIAAALPAILGPGRRRPARCCRADPRARSASLVPRRVTWAAYPEDAFLHAPARCGQSSSPVTGTASATAIPFVRVAQRRASAAAGRARWPLPVPRPAPGPKPSAHARSVPRVPRAPVDSGSRATARPDLPPRWPLRTSAGGRPTAPTRSRTAARLRSSPRSQGK